MAIQERKGKHKVVVRYDGGTHYIGTFDSAAEARDTENAALFHVTKAGLRRRKPADEYRNWPRSGEPDPVVPVLLAPLLALHAGAVAQTVGTCSHPPTPDVNPGCSEPGRPHPGDAAELAALPVHEDKLELNPGPGSSPLCRTWLNSTKTAFLGLTGDDREDLAVGVLTGLVSGYGLHNTQTLLTDIAERFTPVSPVDPQAAAVSECLGAPDNSPIVAPGIEPGHEGTPNPSDFSVRPGLAPSPENFTVIPGGVEVDPATIPVPPPAPVVSPAEPAGPPLPSTHAPRSGQVVQTFGWALQQYEAGHEVRRTSWPAGKSSANCGDPSDEDRIATDWECCGVRSPEVAPAQS